VRHVISCGILCVEDQTVSRMRSPDGNIEVVRKKNLSKSEKTWSGCIEIPGHQFRLRGRKFTDPMVFSPNSRHLALTEFTATDQQISRVVVLDFITGREIIVYNEKAERIEDMACVTSLRWTDNATLRIGTYAAAHLSDGERFRIWKAT
jgi:hypothetical protein